MREVAIVGVGMHPFGRSSTSQRRMVYDAGTSAMKDAGLTFADVGAVYTGYINSGIMTGARFIKEFGLTGVPVEHVENASATGQTTFREAYLNVAGGHSDVAMAIAFDTLEDMAVPGMSKFSVEGAILPAGFFAMWARRRMHEYGSTVETFAEIAAKNWNHAALNPMAQRRSDHLVTAAEVLNSRMIADPHTSMMCAAVGSGAAAAILTTVENARRLQPGRPVITVEASALQSEQYTPGHVFLGPVVGPSKMTQDTANEAYEKAGLGPADLDLVQVHDAFPVEELVYYELLGIVGDGEGDKLIAEGATKLGGRIPFSTDGGLIGRGHPGGPTGLAQIWETTLQLRGEAGARQVEGARIGMTHMVGAGSVCCIHILARRDA
ncbi:MAG: thiolase family protein [Microbacteriaceae bacterium]